MIPVQLFWTNPFSKTKNQLETIVSIFLSAKMIKEIYGEVHVLTDELGEWILKKMKIPYDTMYLDDGIMGELDNFVDAKMLAYKILSEKMSSYLYIDYDVFILGEIPKKDIIVQCSEGANPHPYSTYHYLLDKNVRLAYDYKLSDLRFLNTGLFRCEDKSMVYEYYESYFSTIYDNLHIRHNTFYNQQYRMFLEQTYLLKIIQKYNKESSVYEHYPIDIPHYNQINFMEKTSEWTEMVNKYIHDSGMERNFYVPPSDIKQINETKYTHLMHYKKKPEVMSDVIEYAFNRYPKDFAELMTNMKHIC